MERLALVRYILYTSNHATDVNAINIHMKNLPADTDTSPKIIRMGLMKWIERMKASDIRITHIVRLFFEIHGLRKSFSE